MATIAPLPADRRLSERRFFSTMALVLVAITILGFGPSFYLRGIMPSPRPAPALSSFVIVHGLLFTAWMAVLVAQTQLVAWRRTDLHMKLGIAGMALAVALIPVMYLATVWQVARANQPPFTDPLNWTILPFAAIPAFAYLVFEAWRRRKVPAWHKRMMLGAAIFVVAGPAFGRLPLAPPSFTGFAIQMFAGLLILFAPLAIWDRRSLGAVHPATVRAFLVALAATAIPMLLIGSGGWAPIAAHLPGVGG